MSARERIFARLQAAPQIPAAVAPDVGAWFAAHGRREDLTQRIVRLRKELLAAHAEVHDTSATDWPELVQRIAVAKGLRNVLIGANTPHGDYLDARCGGSLKLVRYAKSIESWSASLFNDIDAGLTVAKSAIAETGSLIVWPDANEPRAMSLVPPLHFILLNVENIHADLYSAMQAERWSASLPTNALLISGPSKTADIQQTLAYGAHGPRELIVLLQHPQGAAA